MKKFVGAARIKHIFICRVYINGSIKQVDIVRVVGKSWFGKSFNKRTKRL